MYIWCVGSRLSLRTLTFEWLHEYEAAGVDERLVGMRPSSPKPNCFRKPLVPRKIFLYSGDVADSRFGRTTGQAVVRRGAV
jgi:hypothetical protein